MKKLIILSLVLLCAISISCNRTKKPVLKCNDFYYSAKQARTNMIFLAPGSKPERHFINGAEFTERGDSPYKSSFDDAVLVAQNVPEGTESIFPFLITSKTIDEKDIYLNSISELNSVLDKMDERNRDEILRAVNKTIQLNN